MYLDEYVGSEHPLSRSLQQLVLRNVHDTPHGTFEGSHR